MDFYADMSNKLRFQIFFGNYEVIYGPNGVDLSLFKSTISGLDRPLERTFESIYRWLQRCFNVNPETHFLTLQTMTNWSGMWELKYISNTEDWKMYMQAALERDWYLAMLVQIHEKPCHVVERSPSGSEPDAQGEGEEEQDEEADDHVSEPEPQGHADEGERIPEIIEQMVNEDLEAEHMQDLDDSSDDEGYIVPAEWRERGFGNSVIQDGGRQHWEYGANVVVQGAKYPNIDALKEAVKQWSISLRREFRVVKSGSKEYEVKCLKDGCPWRVHAYKGRWKSHWQCSIVTEHNCSLEGVEQSHRNLTSAFVANHMYRYIVEKFNFEPKLIIRHIEQDFHYTISYIKAWRAKQKVFEMRFGTYEASYDNLPRMLSCIAERNHGSFYDIYQIPSMSGGPSILQRAFFCLGACVKAFQSCPPVLCIDGTFLTGKYKGTILTAIGVDCNNQVLPVAFAFVEGENTESWYWFLQRVKYNVVARRPNVCLISDRHAGLLAAIEELQSGSETSPPIWPDVRNRWCVRHMGANFFDRFKNKDIMDLFKRLCIQNQQRKFNSIWKTLDEMTAELEKTRASTSTSSRRQSDGLAARKPFSHWIQGAPKENWSFLYDTDGSRYGIRTTNLAECYNMVMRNVRALPLVGIVEFILYGCAKYFRERYMAATIHMNVPGVEFCSRITTYMQAKIEKARLHSVQTMGTRELRFVITCKDRASAGVHSQRVQQETVIKSNGQVFCSCKKPALLHIPCSHLLAACSVSGTNPRAFVSPYYTKEAALQTWSYEVYGVGILGPFTEERQPVFSIPDPDTKRGKGRRQTRRIRNSMDASEAGKTTKECNQCGGSGHNYKKCPLNAIADIAEAGPSGNPADGAPPEFSRTSIRRPRPRRSSASRSDTT